MRTQHRQHDIPQQLDRTRPVGFRGLVQFIRNGRQRGVEHEYRKWGQVPRIADDCSNECSLALEQPVRGWATQRAEHLVDDTELLLPHEKAPRNPRDNRCNHERDEEERKPGRAEANLARTQHERDEKPKHDREHEAAKRKEDSGFQRVDVQWISKRPKVVRETDEGLIIEPVEKHPVHAVAECHE